MFERQIAGRLSLYNMCWIDMVDGIGKLWINEEWYSKAGSGCVGVYESVSVGTRRWWWLLENELEGNCRFLFGRDCVVDNERSEAKM